MAGILATAIAMAGLLPAGAAAAPADQSEALEAFQEVERAKQVATGWTGSVAECRVGSESEASVEATLAAVNIFRSFAGLEPVTFDRDRNEIALSAALAMAAAGRLSHDIDESWPCHSDAAEEGASRSNLALGYQGAGAIEAYLDDEGVESLGHRRWLLDPGAVEFGTGSASRANALYVIDSYGDRERLESVGRENLVAWPPPGHVPWPWIFEDWSATIGMGFSNTPGEERSEYEVSLDQAEVEIRLDGERLGVSGVRAHGEGFGAGPMLSWSVDLPQSMTWADRTLEVSIDGVEIGGEPADFSYEVKAFRPPRPEPEQGLPGPVGAADRCARARQRARGSLRFALRARRVARVRQRQARRSGDRVDVRRARIAHRSFRRSVVRIRHHRQVVRRVCAAR